MNIDANVRRLLFALIRKWKLLVVFAIIGAMLGYFYTANFTTLTYTSTVEFLAYAVDSQQELNDSSAVSNSGEATRTSNTSRMNYAMKMLGTYIEVMSTNEFAEKVASSVTQEYNRKCSAGDIKGSMVVESVQDTAMFKVTVTTTDPDYSYEIAHQLEKIVPETMDRTNNGLVQASVEDRAQKATNAGSLGYPKKMLFAAVAGAVLAAAYVILRSLLDVRIKTEEELIEKYNIPVLGAIPNFEVKSGQSKKGAN